MTSITEFRVSELNSWYSVLNSGSHTVLGTQDSVLSHRNSIQGTQHPVLDPQDSILGTQIDGSIPCFTYGMEAGQTISKLKNPCVHVSQTGAWRRILWLRCTPIYIGPGGERQLDPGGETSNTQRARTTCRPC